MTNDDLFASAFDAQPIAPAEAASAAPGAKCDKHGYRSPEGSSFGCPHCELAASPENRLSDERYHGIAANRTHMSVSQYRSWLECPRRRYAEDFEGYQQRSTDALVAGKYCHRVVLEPHLAEQFLVENPEIAEPGGYTHAEMKEIAELNGVDLTGAKSSKDKTMDALSAAGIVLPAKELKYKSPFGWIPKTIAAFNAQPAFKGMIARGQHEIAIEFIFGGLLWKARIDNLRLEDQQIDDLKFMAEFGEKWCTDRRRYLPWYEKSRYDIQAAVYRFGTNEVFGVECTPNILAASKEPTPDVEWIQYRDGDALKRALEEVESNLDLICSWKSKAAEPPRCDRCDYCRSTKVLKMPKVPGW